MVGIVAQKFGGIAPRIASKQLSEHMATEAVNVDLFHEDLRPFVQTDVEAPYPYTVEDIDQMQSLYLGWGNDNWLARNAPAKYVLAPVPAVTEEMVYTTDEEYPKVAISESVEVRMGIPRPAAEPTLGILNVGDTLSDPLQVRDQAYVYTWVDGLGREGPPSAVSLAVTVGPGAVVTVYIEAYPTSMYYVNGVSKFRIYRSNTGANGTVFQYVGEKDALANPATDIFDDDLEPDALQEALITWDWIGPPDDDADTFPDGPMQNLTEMPNGVLAGSSGRSVYFSVPHVPHAWPAAFRLTTSRPVVAMTMIAGGLFAATDDKPFLIIGTQPGSMVEMPIESAQPCVSVRSMVDMGDFCVYASPRGLVVGQGSDAKLISQDWMDTDSWQALQPETIHAYLWRERYVAFYGDIDDGTGFIFDPRAADKGLVLLTGDRVAAGFRAPSDDILYVAMKNDDPAPDNWGVFEFGEGNSDKTLEWRSKEFLVEKPVNMVCGRVEADAYPVQFAITVDGVQKADFAVPDAKTFRLPRGFLGRRWQFKVSGTRQVSLIGLWDSMSEVQ